MSYTIILFIPVLTVDNSTDSCIDILIFCKQICSSIQRSVKLCEHFMVSDEAHLHFNGSASKNSTRFWTTQIPYTIAANPL